MRVSTSQTTSISRRKFVTAGTALALGTVATAAIAAPAKSLSATALHTGKRKSKIAREENLIGEGDYQYKTDHTFCQLPDKYTWQTTHNVAVDSSNNLYVIHEGRGNQKDHPSIFVFDPQGKFVRAFGSQFQGGGHGIEIRKEGSEEFLYVAAYQGIKSFAKMTLDGHIVWYKKAPMESGVYADGEDTSTQATWNRKGFLPTNFAFLDDGGFLLADGYGSYYIHQFDKDANWVRCFAGAGKEDGKFNLSHGLWVDDREGREKSVVVTDRSRDQVQILDMDGKHLETMKDFGLPANVDIYENIMMIPELKGRVTLLDETNKIVARLGDGRQRLDEVKDLRNKPDQWTDGQFVHPHDACFDAAGNIFVAEWVHSGRVSKLTKVS